MTNETTQLWSDDDLPPIKPSRTVQIVIRDKVSDDALQADLATLRQQVTQLQAQLAEANKLLDEWTPEGYYDDDDEEAADHE